MKKNLILFISLSVAAHGAVLVTIYNQNENSPFVVPHKKHGAITVNVNISKPVIVTNKVVMISKPKVKTKDKSTTVAKHEIEKQLNNEYQKQYTKNIKTKADGETISKILNTEIAKYFYYPKAAQRREWQGKVVLRFIIQASGNIKQVQVAESSGYAILDNAAMKALKKIDTRKDFIVALNGQNIDQLLPVIYQLIQ